MRPHLSLVAALASTLVGVSACGTDPAAPVPTDGLRIAVAPLSLPGISDACYDLAVYNATTPAAANLVWSQTGLCSSRFGDGAGSLTYIGTCDASVTNDNLVTLVLDELFRAGVSPGGTTLATTEYVNPCPASAPCALNAPCVENADTLVEFNLTIMRDADQGFFDVAVSFEDVFCSAKVDCQSAAGSDLMLSFDPVTGERVPAVVVAFACTAGAGTDTHLWLDGLRLVCDGGTVSLPIDNDPPGNIYSAASPAPEPLLQVTTFRGQEQLTDATGADYAKVYANATLGVDKAAIGSDCSLVTTATASDGPFATPFTTPANTTWPLIEVNVPLWDATTQDFVCTQHPLNDPDAPAGQGVFTRYTTTSSPKTFSIGIRREGEGVTLISAPLTSGVSGHVFQGTAADELYTNQPGVSGVHVRLYADAGLQTLVATTTTLANGGYELSAPDGVYYVHIDAAELATSGYGQLLTSSPRQVTVSGLVARADFAVQRSYPVTLRFFDGTAFGESYDGSQPLATDVPYALNVSATGASLPGDSDTGIVTVDLPPGSYCVDYEDEPLFQAGYRWTQFYADPICFDVFDAALVVDAPLDPLRYTTATATLYVDLDGSNDFDPAVDPALSSVDVRTWDTNRAEAGAVGTTDQSGGLTLGGLYVGGSFDLTVDTADPDLFADHLDLTNITQQVYPSSTDPQDLGIWGFAPLADGTIEAAAWYDVNRNGVLDLADPPLDHQSFTLQALPRNFQLPFWWSGWQLANGWDPHYAGPGGTPPSTPDMVRWRDLRPWSYSLALTQFGGSSFPDGATVLGDSELVIDLPLEHAGPHRHDFLVAPGTSSLSIYLGDTESLIGHGYEGVSVSLTPDGDPSHGLAHWPTVAAALAPLHRVTGADGWVRFQGLVPGVYTLHWDESDVPGFPGSTERDFSDAPPWTWFANAGSSQTISLLYQRYQSVLVRAVDESNAPVSGVAVTLVNINGGRAPVSGQTSGVAGQHLFQDNVPSGTWVLAVDSVPTGTQVDPSWSGCQLLVVPGGSGYECVVPLVADTQPGFGDLEGLVYLGDDTTLLANVTVDLYDELDVFVDTAYTDENGAFAFYGLPEGNYYVVPSASDFDLASAVMDPAPYYTVTANTTSPVTLRLYPYAPQLTLTVTANGTDASGLSIQDTTALTFQVTATPSLYFRFIDEGYIRVECDNFEYATGLLYDLEWDNFHLHVFRYSLQGTPPSDPTVEEALHETVSVNETDPQLVASYTQSTFGLWSPRNYQQAGWVLDPSERSTDCYATWYDGGGTVIATSNTVSYHPYH